jgi:O-antigen biosynthesis protein
MSGQVGDSHVYLRNISQDKRTSLSVIAGYVTANARVLDLGTGSGALGKHLKTQLNCTVDGFTLNEQEAQLARPSYRHVQVGDLEDPHWVAAFEGRQYDFIVCADVIEHLRQPQAVLRSCRNLLAPNGRLLISVPNAAYCGLLAELMEGDFRYRDEGLLDRTHLRFFTRHSLMQFLADESWACETVDSIDLPPLDSEFKAPFDKLPPAVERYLTALPDAAVYQLIVVAKPVEVHHSKPDNQAAPLAHKPETAKPSFSSQLYFGTAHGFQEDRKQVVPGQIGLMRQTLRFELPRDKDTNRLRLDLADRPGFVHLYAITLLTQDQPAWRWRVETDGLVALDAAPRHEMTLRLPWGATSAAILLFGDDPWIELPIPPEVVSQCAASGQGTLQLELGWPMSADYLSLADTVEPLHRDLQLAQRTVQQLSERQAAALAAQQAAQRDAQQWQADMLRAQAREQAAAEAAQAAVSQAQQAQAQAQTAMQDAARNHSEKMQAVAYAQEATSRANNALQNLEAARLDFAQQGQNQQQANQQLISQAGMLAQQKTDLLNEKNLLSRRLLAMQREAEQLQAHQQALAQHLAWIENSTVFRATRPLVHAKMALANLLKPKKSEALVMALPVAVPLLPTTATVDIIVPVYRGLHDTRRCIESVLASQCQTPWRLIVLNDASPEPEVTQWLRDNCARHAQIVLLENAENLGFVGTVNRGMSHSTQHDVLLLNSDTEVTNDWLDRLRSAAYCDARVASVTPFSNNATICSYPRFCEPNDLPVGWDTARLDALCAQTNAGQVVDVPTGVGFCMYIRRDSLNEVGLFDVEQFGMGYGEENDFCCRAQAMGWRNLHALDTFVLHTGGVSFGDSKSTREREAVEKLRRLHPGYEPQVHAFVAQDPAAPARRALDLARLRSAKGPCVLAVLHDRAGGTVRHVRELAHHLNDHAQFFTLTPAPNGMVLLESVDTQPNAVAVGPSKGGLRFQFSVATQWPLLLQTLQALAVAHVHYHHLLGHDGKVFGLAEELGLTWDVTAHDFFSVCPQISLTDHTDRYCGELGVSQCVQCLEKTPAPGRLDIHTWRASHATVLTRARYVLTPSADTARRLLKVMPLTNLRVAPHTDIADVRALPAPRVRPIGTSRALRVVILGGVSRIKGADLLEDVARLAAKQGVAVEFHLLGHAYRHLQTQPKAALTVHGAYEEAELPQLLDWLQPDVVWFPAVWPETYSYTLSACLLAGLPVVAPNLGAFPERLSARHWSWVVNWDMPPAEFLDFFETVRCEHFATGVAPRIVWPLESADARLPSAPWVYKRDYLPGLTTPVRDVAQLAQDKAFLMAQYSTNPAGLATTQPSGIKGRALRSLVAMRAWPVLSPLARVIPLRVQTRLKSWLRA